MVQAFDKGEQIGPGTGADKRLATGAHRLHQARVHWAQLAQKIAKDGGNASFSSKQSHPIRRTLIRIMPYRAVDRKGRFWRSLEPPDRAGL